MSSEQATNSNVSINEMSSNGLLKAVILMPMDLPITSDELFSVKEHNFNELALKLFRYQAQVNDVYSEFVNHLGVDIDEIMHWSDVPFLPIHFFKSRMVISGNWRPDPACCFKSSSTTGFGQSHHYYRDLSFYKKSVIEGFKSQFGASDDWTILTLLPGYHLNPNASLLYMMKQLGVTKFHSYIDDKNGLYNALKTASGKVMLVGVTHALLDFVQEHTLRLPELMILETGGMKGRKKELTRYEVHEMIKDGFGVEKVGSEYGMTELFSQAYSKENGRFMCPGWMRVITREVDDPLAKSWFAHSGGLNIVDLANVDSCAFIATDDIGRMHKDDSFEVLGRIDHSEVRGCNVLAG